MIRLCLMGLLTLVLHSGIVSADHSASLPPAAKIDVDFVRDIQPIFREHCVKCHGANKQRGDLRLDDKSAAMKGGESFAPAIVIGNSAESPLIRFSAGLVEGMEMPPEGESKLSEKQIGLLRAWIDQGAKWPEESGNKDQPVTHWSFQPLTRPKIPSTSNRDSDGLRNPIDNFVAARLAEPGNDPARQTEPVLRPSVEADRRTLIRRATFDLIGLPPTPEEMTAFLDEPSPDAFERLIDRLIASPHFGERWARHWLDVVRFAESDGFEMNQARRNAWPYRDYAIRAFNEDKPVNEFLFEQLAGDTVGVDEATGFLVGGAMDRVKSPDPGLTAQQRADELHDMVSTTGSAFIGLTVGCARCHNHKFDPISQTDYYALKAVFAGVQHGERPLRPKNSDRQQPTIEAVGRELAQVEQQLRRFEPLAFVPATRATAVDLAVSAGPSTLLIDDEVTTGGNERPTATFVAARAGLESYQPGTAKGQREDPGDSGRFPNLGLNYSFWNNVAGKDVFTWNPHVSGQWRVWLSWSCGSDKSASAATYLLDVDGDLATTDDQHEIAEVDQHGFADGTRSLENQPLWSGFYDVGPHEFTPESRIVLRGGESSARATADLLCLQFVDPEHRPQSAGLPCLRSSVQRQTNVERFPPVRARFVKFVIQATTGGSPCIDELEVFTTASSGTGSRSENIALASRGTRATSSSNLPGFEIHQLAFVNDGRYGNSASWISNEPDRGWVQLEFPSIVEIDRILWSRDRPENGQYQDRIATTYRIEAGLTRDTLQVIASSDDRLGFDRQLATLAPCGGLSSDEQQTFTQLTVRRNSLREHLQSLSTFQIGYAGRFSAPESTNRLHRGDPLQPREPTPPGGLSSFGSAWKLPIDSTDVDRRRGLADWITASEHPLTMRVMSNRLWQFHFGQGLVTTPSDFGRNGAVPTHPALLNWLACEARANSSPKRLHRMMMTSLTYRQSSAVRPEGLQADAGTRLLWRFPPRRLEAEPIRDAILAVSGNLDDRMYGVGFDLFEPNTNYVKVYTTKRDLGPMEWRRMVYQSKPRMQLDEIFGQFDCPDAGQIAPRRTSSITALQALNLLNSQFILEQSGQFADRLSREVGKDSEQQVVRAFSLAFQRNPSDDERAASIDLIRDHGLQAFCRAILNANEFLFVF